MLEYACFDFSALGASPGNKCTSLAGFYKSVELFNINELIHTFVSLPETQNYIKKDAKKRSTFQYKRPWHYKSYLQG